MTDCTLCLEWEICPFHKPEPKQEQEQEPELTKYTVDAEADTVRIKVSQPTVIHGRVVSDCGHYVRTYVNGRLVDEEPID